jgi:large subunit ribosomal protein L37e
MTKGTTSQGARHGRTHILCRRCGRLSFHVQWKKCSACGFPRASRRRFNWSVKAIKRRTTGTGRTRSLKVTNKRIANNFRTLAKKAKKE